MSKCELCEIPPDKQWEFWTVVACDTCHVPMAVLKRHDTTIQRPELIELLLIWETRHPDSKLRTQARKITDHIHFHFVPQ